MKLLLINKEFFGGGAATACRRLFYALRKKSEKDIAAYVQQLEINTPNVQSLYKKKWAPLFYLAIEKILFLFYEKSKAQRFYFSTAAIGNLVHKKKMFKTAEVIHLHWINQGFISLYGLKKIVQLNKPIVWTMHDMWAFTGGCHYSGECTNYLTGCGNCSFLRHPANNDLSAKLSRKKLAILSNANIVFVGCSSWMANVAKTSLILKDSKIVNIPNPIDTDLYKPLEKSSARTYFNLPKEKKIILFGAAKITDTRKGLTFLLDAIKILGKKNPNDYLFVTFGRNSDLPELPIETRFLPYIKNELEIVKLYNAADLLVVPSLEDNLPNTIMESLSCGTPVVAFNAGGIPEMVDHLQNGYLAEYKSADDLVKGIQWALFKADYKSISANARNKVLKCYSEEVVADRYTTLYKELLWKK
jgi:glycosyltransferase involved in cell wall biosynthesis